MALNILCDAYCSDSEESTESQNEDSSKIVSDSKKLLPVPQAITKLFDPINQLATNTDSGSHFGRIRSFPHVRGNWATHVFIPYPSKFESDMRDQVCHFTSTLQDGGVQWHVVDDFHLSVSKTVVIPHHFIEPMIEALQNQLLKFSAFDLTFSALDMKFFVNDEGTRSFCGFEITNIHMRRLLSAIVERIDSVMKEYRCDTYYINPSFHVSVMWCLSDVTVRDDCEKLLAKMQEFWERVEHDCPEIFAMPVSSVVCKAGNKTFLFKLATVS